MSERLRMHEDKFDLKKPTKEQLLDLGGRVEAFSAALQYETESPLEDLERERIEIVRSIQQAAEKLNREKCVVPVSGGLDSAVSLQLAIQALGKEKVIGLYIPNRFTESISTECIKLLEDELRITIKQTDVLEKLCAQYPGYTDSAKAAEEKEAQNPPGSEDPNWLRYLRGEYKGYGKMMNYLFVTSVMRTAIVQAEALINDAFFISSPNKTEKDVGLYTSGGPDCGGDLQPIVHLSKTEVRQMARHIKVPDEIIDRVATGDLGPVLSDEKSMGCTFVLIDLILKAHNEYQLEPKDIAMVLEGVFVEQMPQLEAIGYTDPLRIINYIIEMNELAKAPGGTPYKRQA
jgi:NAD+ synthase